RSIGLLHSRERQPELTRTRPPPWHSPMQTPTLAPRRIELFGAAFDPDTPADALALRAYRKRRVCDALARRDLAAIVLFNPINIRYACDARNMQVYGLHNPCRYVFAAADGHTVLFD